MFHLLVKLALAVLFLGAVGFFVFKYSGFVSNKDETNSVNSPQQQLAGLVEKCGEECEVKIREIVNQAIATLSAQPQEEGESTATPEPTPVKTYSSPVSYTTPPTKTSISYVPVGSSGSTTKTDWTGLSNTDFFFDIGEYGKVKEARWSANVKVFQNGEAFARLFDVTHGVAVPGSEISTKSTSYSLIESGTLTFLGGKNVYRVQMKSLTGYEASFDSGKIKIISE